MAKRKVGRPRIEIDKVQFEKLCSIICTQDEICGWFDCDQMTLGRWCRRTYGENFEDTHKRLSAGGKISVRRRQYELALQGNVTMLIWLGKQILKQSDSPLADEGREVPVPVFSIVRKEA